ncbi:nonribosomal siderophore peptide synthetase [Emericellopsis atlantica]|uniref:Nonribosomal siderophore peptide synthetase n=1 Tax=Emericellopsis atlantica TaxID=2614577 RepID=A0A9P7ZPQ0_9HYPO|nr:nonribosomal siderophore peptide synthetase [Emericellopsis atlantica]KAG9255576.1 nonribosomal siderophore peptide synthetase [Emericellopsis atlantica]
MDSSAKLSIINPQPAKLPGPALLHELVAGTSSSPALDHLQGTFRTSFTYDELHAVSDTIADKLSSVVRNRDAPFVVPILMRQSPLLYASLLGILKAGAAFCPLNLDAPPERVSFIIQDVSAAVVLVEEDLVARMPEGVEADVMTIQWMSEKPATSKHSPKVSSTDLAYVMYTSGSTGTPKGVGLSHGAATQALLAHERHIPQFSRFLQFAAPTFDVSVFEIFFPLARGRTLVSVERGQLLDDLAAAIRETNVDACELTPTVAGSLLRSRNAVPELKLLLTIGEMLTEPVIHEFGGGEGRESILWAMYGPTEATIHCTLQPAMQAVSSVQNIGFPLDTVSAFVIQPAKSDEEALTVLPLGEVGELAVGGHQLAEGYLNRPTQTAAAFIETPYGRLYRTGDKARVLSNGTLECLGRLSEGQVKLRGQRLEINEVQQAILRVKSCHGAVVAVHESTLVAFCATDPGVLEDVIRDECKKWLPQFMIPSVLMLSDSFPKLPSGKVDKRKLLADYATNLSANTNSGEEHGIPGSFMSAFMDILGPHVEAHTILPAAGLDSLSAIRIASSLGAVGYPTSAASLIKCKSVADAWHLVRTAEGETEAVPASSQRSLLHRLEDVLAQNPDTHVAKFAVSDILPCSALQTAMLAETVGQPDLYWNELELDVADSANRVAAAFTTIIEQTAILRGIFVFLDGTFVCLVKQDVDEEQIKIVDGQSHFSREQTIDSPTFQVQLYDNNHGGTRVWILAHHAIYDGWSMDIILADVNRLLSGQSIPKRTPFAEVVAMQRWLASSPAADRSGAYWAAHLQGWTKDPFPTLVDRLGGQQDPLVIADQVEIPYPKVDAASKDLGCSVQALFQAALYVVWAGILGSTDVVLGVVSSGRSLPMGGIEEIIGPCIAALPLRVDFEKLSDAEQLLRHIHSCNRAMLENSIIPLGDIRKMMGLRASQTVYDLLFVYQQSSKSESKRRGLLKEIRRLDRLETKVLFEAEPNDTSFSIQITYHSDSARGDMMRMLLQQFKLAFGQLIEQSHSALADTRRALIPVPATYNTSPVPLEGTPDLAAMFEQVVEENSDKDALSFIEPGHESPFAKTTVTYQELNVLGNRIAHFLLSQGVGANQIVGVFMEKSIFLYATILAVLKTGCAYLPLPPSTPADRVEDILRLAKVRHCAVDTAAVRLFGHLREARLVDVERTPLDDFRSRNLCIPPDRDRLAYVIFTSGTTGTPKGVAVTHGNIVSNIDYLSGVYPVKRGAQSNFLQACSQAFDVSVFEIFFAWKTGMCLCTGVNDTLFADLALTVNGLSITHLSLTPTVASLISRETCPGVEFLVTAGEPLTRSVLDQWGDILWQGYGPSETTNICSVKQMQTDMVVEHLGWVFPNTSVMVMAIGSLDPVPVGWVGEFCYGGDQVAQGYLNMPELTAEKFIQHPRFGRIYHSGDIGRMLPDGSLVILGRIDDQLKLRGQRIEAAEISNIIASTPWASSAIVMIGRRAPNMPEQLVAFYVPAEHVGGDGLLDIDHEACAGLYSLMQSKLPSYMVPSYLIPLARIPMTKSGKINKKQLQDWFQDLPSRYLEAAVPQATLNEDGSEWSTMESDIHAALIQSLKISATEANRWTPFANLGIDSVSAIRLARDLSSSLNRRVAVSSIIRNSSIAQFARHLGQHDVEERAVIAEKPLLPQSCIEQLRHSFISQDKAVASILPCTPLQAAMLSRGGRNYYNRVLLRLKVEASKMQAFWNCMTERHEILRTCFATTEDAEHSIAQVVLREWSIPWHQFDAKTPSFEEIIHSHLEQLPDPVDAMTPPVSLALIRRGTSSFLSFICHHSLYDGVAINILWREVEALAAGEQLPPAIRYEPLLQEMANLPGNTEAFWKKHFHDFVPSYAFPSNAGGSTDQALITKSVRTSLETLNHRLKGLGVSMLAACQAAWAVTLSISYKSTDICFGNVNSGRTADVDSIERLVAPTFNTIPLRVDLSTASHGHSLLEYFHRLSLNVFPYQFTPLRLVQKISGCQGVGLFETLLLLQQPLHPMDDRVWILEEDKGTMDLPVVCEIRVSELVEDLRASLLAHPQLPPWHVFAHDGEDGITMTLVIHHALYDAQSLDELLVGLGKTLQGEADELNITPVEPGLQVIMSRHMADQTETRLFWESKATDVVINTFPTMTPLREPATSLRSETSTLSLSFSHLQDAAKDAGVTVHAAIHAAWARVLSSYLGEEAVVFGSTISERTSEATKSTPIPCITTLPVLARATPSNLGLLESIMDFTTKVRKHQSASLSSVQKWLGHPATPIFDTLVSYRKRDEHEPSRPFELLSDNATLDYKVSMEIEAGPDDCVRLTTTFMPHVLPAEQGRILLDQFDAVLSHLVLHPGETEDDLHRLTPKLFSQLPPEVPVMPTTVQYLHQLVEEKARTNPETIALEFIDSLHQGTIEKRIWNYRQLDERGNQVANMLRTKAAVGSIVAVHFDKCPEAYFSILGILKAGCSFVALDPTAPASRKSFILEDSKAPCVLTTAESTFSSTTTEVVRIDMSVLDEFSIESAVIDITSPEATCYCLYTSGTTGTPKGCEITHENAVQAMMAFQDLFSGHWQADSRWLQFASLHFDVSVLEQYWTWSVGITLVAAPKDMILDDLTGSINKLGITHIDLTPSLARLTHPSEVPSLCKGVFITGGESLKQEILDVWGPKAVIHNAYGPTEATIGVTMYQRVPANGRPSNIGKQFPNVGSYVFKLGTEVPVLRGGVGELCVSGKLVGKGYLNRPDLTAERFPTLQHFAEKIYRTGDLVRVLHDGCFEFLGRADDQVKLRGQRLEIGEINHAIRGVPEIQDAATVVATQGSSEKSVLVAFIVSATTNNKGNLEVMPDTESLGLKAKEACRTKLPGYMVPTYFLQLPFIPLSVNNKAEAKELRRLFANLSHAQLSALTATPRSSRSTVSVSSLTKLTKALSTYSGLKQNDVTEDTSMFDLGVDSITVLRLASHLKEQGFDAATPTALLRNPVINDLAFVLCQKTSHSVEAGIKEAKQLMAACKHRYLSSACRAFHVQPENIEYIAPCSPLQGGIVSRSLASAEGHAYFNTFELKLSPHLSEDELRHAWDSLVSELAILRTRFLATPSGPIQVALKAVQLPWEHVELPTEEETQHALTQMRKAWLSTNGHNVSEPLQIYYVVRGGESRLFINIFHGIYDGMSFDFMLSRLAAEVDGRDLPDGPLFVEALTHGPLQDFSSSESFWKQHLRDWMPPVMAGLGGVDSSRPVASSRIIPQGPIDLFRRSENTTLQAVLLGVWSSVLQKYHSGVATVGVIAAGRSIDLPGIENTIGPLFNTLPFFHKFQGQDTWASLIHSAHDFGLSTLDCQHVSLQHIQKWCSGGRPLFNTLFALQIEQPEDHGLWQLVDGELNPDYPLAFEATMMKGGNLRVQLVAQGHVATVAVLDEMLGAFSDSLRQAMKDSSQSVPFEPSNNDPASSGRTEPSIVGEEPPTGFTWTEIAETIRREICALSGASEGDIRGTTTMLELGLDSIDVMKLSAALRRCGVELAASQIMRLQSVSNIVSSAEETTTSHTQIDNNTDLDATRQRLRDSLARSAVVDMADVEDIVPATPLQESMVTAMVESDFQWYFNHDLLQLSEDADVERLKKAWTQVVEAHPILRTGFYPVEDDSLENAFYQVIYTKNDPWVECLVTESLDEADRVMERCRLRAKDGKGQTALLQLSLMSVGSQRFVVLSMAHALYDGWSLSLLYRELQNAYHGQLLEARSPDIFLCRLLEAPSAQSQEFWSDYLQGARPTHLGVSLQTEPSTTPGFSEATSDMRLDTIKAFCKDLGITMQTLCQASWALVLAYYTKQLDIIFGVIMSGRDFGGAEELMFPTMNTVAMRYILHGTARSFLQYVEESMSDVRQYQSYPLRKALTAARAPMGGLFNTLFMLQKSAETGSSTLVHSVRGVSAVDYPVCVEAEVEQGQLSWRIAVQPGFVPLESPSNLLKQLDGVLSFLIKSPDSDLLSFTAAGISLGGLPSFTIKEDAESEDESRLTTPLTDDEDWSGIASTIRSVLSQASGVDETSIRMTDTLYHLGLDSISSLKVSRLLKQQDLDLRPRDLIRAESIAHLVEMATANQSDGEGSQDQEAAVAWQLPPSLDVDGLLLHHNLQHSDVEAILPALPMQVFVLGTWQNTNGAVFNPMFTYELDSACSKEEIMAAWGLVTASTPILRTRFMATGDKQLPLLQVVLKSAASDLVHLQPGERTEAGTWHLRLHVHHALYDGVSLPLLMQHLLHALVSRSLPNSSLDLWNRYATNPYLPSSVSARKAFWTSYLSGVEPDSEARTGYPIRPRVSYIARSAVRDTSLLQQHAAAKGVGVQSLFLAAYAKVLLARGHEGGGEEVVFGVYLANRQEDTSLDASFPRLNLVPLRVKATGPLESVARRVQRDLSLIMSQGRAAVGLWEVEVWTGVRVTSFVNFLSLPDRDEEYGSSPEAVRLRVVEGGAGDEEPTAYDASAVGDVVVRHVFPVRICGPINFVSSMRTNACSLLWISKHHSGTEVLTLVSLALKGRLVMPRAGYLSLSTHWTSRRIYSDAFFIVYVQTFPVDVQLPSIHVHTSKHRVLSRNANRAVYRIT